jgi:hypothetical protein
MFQRNAHLSHYRTVALMLCVPIISCASGLGGTHVSKTHYREHPLLRRQHQQVVIGEPEQEDDVMSDRPEFTADQWAEEYYRRLTEARDVRIEADAIAKEINGLTYTADREPVSLEYKQTLLKLLEARFRSVALKAESSTQYVRLIEYINAKLTPPSPPPPAPRQGGASGGGTGRR